ncbi:ribosome biogenesis factor YjgA [Tepidimonas aquatica]|nr:ribosome biogenesis factor YjgA [Tepidimonas aquatica]
MPRKPPKGYFVRGHFVAYGSAEDAELKRAAKWDAEYSKTDLKRLSAERQALGERLLELNAAVLQRLGLPEDVLQALTEARRIDAFEARRRQLQYIGKLMRRLDDELVAALQAALDEQHRGHAAQTARLHEAEQWRERLVASDDALHDWRTIEPEADWQRLRALIRQARKDRTAPNPDHPGQPARHSRAWRELFQHVRAALDAHHTASV